MDQFILFGDSLTQQVFSPEGLPFGGRLSDAYIRKLDIVNRGFSGYNTSQALSLLPKFMPSPSQARVRFMLVFFGANDARLPDTPGGPQQHVPVEVFNEYFRGIVGHECVRVHEGVRIVLVTPPPVDERKLESADEEKFGRRMLRRAAATTAMYAGAVRELGKEIGVAVLDLHAEMASRCISTTHLRDCSYLPGSKDGPVSERLQEYLRDGLHFSSSGYEVLYEELMALIQREWPDQMPERLPFVFPAWDDEEALNQPGSLASL